MLHVLLLELLHFCGPTPCLNLACNSSSSMKFFSPYLYSFLNTCTAGTRDTVGANRQEVFTSSLGQVLSLTLVEAV